MSKEDILQLDTKRRLAETNLIAIQVCMQLTHCNPMISQRRATQIFGSWFTKLVKEGSIIGKPEGKSIKYDIRTLWARQQVELEQAIRESTPFIK